MNRRFHVNCDHLAGNPVRHFVEIPIPSETGIIDQEVNRGKFAGYLLEKQFPVFSFAQVHCEGMHLAAARLDFFFKRSQASFPPRNHDHMQPFSRQEFGESGADAR